jgi:hypothetical protein
LTDILLLQDEPLKEWTPYRDEFLSELLRLKAHGDVERVICPVCKILDHGEPSYRCMECLGEDVVCQKCCVKSHRDLPLHVIEVSPVIWGQSFLVTRMYGFSVVEW